MAEETTEQTTETTTTETTPDYFSTDGGKGQSGIDGSHGAKGISLKSWDSYEGYTVPGYRITAVDWEFADTVVHDGSKASTSGKNAIAPGMPGNGGSSGRHL